jgi:hypothetical protein
MPQQQLTSKLLAEDEILGFARCLGRLGLGDGELVDIDALLDRGRGRSGLDTVGTRSVACRKGSGSSDGTPQSGLPKERSHCVLATGS